MSKRNKRKNLLPRRSANSPKSQKVSSKTVVEQLTSEMITRAINDGRGVLFIVRERAGAKQIFEQLNVVKNQMFESWFEFNGVHQIRTSTGGSVTIVVGKPSFHQSCGLRGHLVVIEDENMFTERELITEVLPGKTLGDPENPCLDYPNIYKLK